MKKLIMRNHGFAGPSEQLSYQAQELIEELSEKDSLD